jgi:hypothetical protein
MGAKQTTALSARKSRARKIARGGTALPATSADVAMGATFMLPFGTDDSPPWLVEKQEPASKPKQKRKAAPAKAQPKAKTAKRPAARKTRAAPTRTATMRKASTRKTLVSKTEPKKPLNDNKSMVALADPAPAIVGPLPRAHAPVVWQKTGPLDAIGYWLRINSKALIARLRGVDKGQAQRKAMLLPKRRSRRELLLELAVLREENALMRSKLGLPALPFGRQIVDKP